MQNEATVFDDIVQRRRSMRIFSADAPMDEGAVQRSLQRALLAPNSSNMQVWEFYRVSDPEKLQVLAKYCMGQRAATTARELVLVVVRRDLWKKRADYMVEFNEQYYADKPELQHRLKRIKKYYRRLMPMYYFQDWFGIWGRMRQLIVFFASFRRPVVWQVRKQDLRVVCHKSAALAAQTFMLSMSAEGYDTCPMEGFDSRLVKRYMHLPRTAEINMIIACGPGTPEGLYNERIRVPEEDVLFTR
ncbi:MAG: nitroreductase family protein [Chitinophagales bacterium]|nr:nitroreductase family protein [Chitinophagales bacterium]HAE13866.1 nitroreductase family protein [Bacteroidota bacterium]MCB9021057.1 nitroreductase family protein [Chitinophagales bacterium]HAE35937.1 nitroreductase family protein [Bacteroidota bacterium]HPE98167.1 nitroreductase family protein [Chitinophagales bacterium]